MATIFDGKTYSLKKKELLKAGVTLLREKGIIPHLATILIGEDIVIKKQNDYISSAENRTSSGASYSASKLYVNLKKKFMEDIGCQVDIYNINSKTNISEIDTLINSLNEDKTVHGIMIQFPLPKNLENSEEKLVNLIDPKKDVDGLQINSKYLHPTAKAVTEILSLALNETAKEVKNICVVGASGMVGKPLVKALELMGYKIIGVDKDTQNLKGATLQADVVVSTTGVVNLITPEMVKNDTIVIDVGSPFGDVSPEVSEKVSFVTPVPGGVGPVTITCLAENLILSASNAKS